MVRVAVSVDEVHKGTVDEFNQLWEIFPKRVAALGASHSPERLVLMSMFRLSVNETMFSFVAHMPQSLASHPEKFLGEIANIVDAEVEIEPLRTLTKAFAEDIDTGNIRAEALPLKMVPLFSFVGFDLERPPELVRPFAYKRVFLVGNALLGCPPLLGMGAAMGFEDVCEMIDLLAYLFKWEEGREADVSDGELGVVAEWYRGVRSDRLKRVMEESSFPKMRYDKSVYFPVRKSIYDFKSVATGWSIFNNSV